LPDRAGVTLPTLATNSDVAKSCRKGVKVGVGKILMVKMCLKQGSEKSVSSEILWQRSWSESHGGEEAKCLSIFWHHIQATNLAYFMDFAKAS